MSIQEQKRSPMTLARIRAVANSPNGFETITPQGARQLLDEHQKEVRREKDRRVEYRQQNHSLNTALQRQDKESRAATAALERVRALIPESDRGQTLVLRKTLEAALAGQPEVPCLVEHETHVCIRPAGHPGLHDMVPGQPEAPKGQEELTTEERNELKAPVNCGKPALTDKLLRLYDAANARADAADLSKKEALDEANARWRLDFGTIGRLESERDQLAARVKELEGDLTTERASFRDLTATRCTPEERAVLEAMRDYPEYILEDWKREGTPRRKALGHAELANREAKAKRMP